MAKALYPRAIPAASRELTANLSLKSAPGCVQETGSSVYKLPTSLAQEGLS